MSGDWLWHAYAVLAPLYEFLGSEDGSPAEPEIPQMVAARRGERLAFLRGLGVDSMTSVVHQPEAELIESLLQRPAEEVRFPGTLLERVIRFSDAPEIGLARALKAEVNKSAELALLLARQFRRWGYPREALDCLQGLDSVAALLERAKVYLFAGNREAAQKPLLEARRCRKSERESGQVEAFFVRQEVNRGHYGEGRRLAAEAPMTVELLESRALAELYDGEAQEALLTLDWAWELGTGPEERARVLAVRALALSQAGQSEEAFDAWTTAAHTAQFSGARLEAGTYLTSLASAALEEGRLKVAEEAAQEALECFSALARPEQGVRALLVLTALHSALNNKALALRAGARALRLLPNGEDPQARLYLLLALIDVSAPKEEQVIRAQLARLVAEVDSWDAVDRLYIAAYDKDLGAQTARVSLGLVDYQECQDPNARLRYLTQCIAHHLDAPPRGGERVLDEDEGNFLLEVAANASLGGCHDLESLRFLRQADALAAKGTDSAYRRQLNVAMQQVLHRLKSAASVEQNIALSRWQKEVRAQPTMAASYPSSSALPDLTRMAEALSEYRGVQELLQKAIDLVLTWGGLERGVILLRAPGNRLVMRAGRHMTRGELAGEQEKLSLSLARQCLKQGRSLSLFDVLQAEENLSTSIHFLGLRSAYVTPLRARGEVYGVLYLDDRSRPDALGEGEIRWTETIATLTALALASERMRLSELREAARVRRWAAREARRAQLNAEELKELRSQKQGQEPGWLFSKEGRRILSRSPKMERLIELVRRVAPSELSVLITGESGTGKELLARALVDLSLRPSAPFVTENCAALPETLLESALFGHQKGAFTGATEERRGLFERADQGTLFLDEIGEMSLGMQKKLLRVLAEGSFRPVGGGKERHVDVRVVCATHRDLEQLVREGLFREDLFYRLNVVHLELPPLRERREDIPLLLDYFSKSHGQDQPIHFSPLALQRLTSYSWPGNIRQLENEVQRLLVLAGQNIRAADLSIPWEQGDTLQSRTLKEQVDSLERQLIQEALEVENLNKTRVAERLGLSRYGLQKKMKRLGVSEPEENQRRGSKK
ncbi:MAG: sigma-54-dependent Fis family transcriptional regulator [Polyangiaceae bacterium]|nr:sigma-54-dependent Fis family transcriptional regulator [Polyangiaceae bacterium]